MLPILLTLTCAAALPDYAAPPPLPPPAADPAEDPFAWEARYEPERARIVATLAIPEGHTVYRDQVEVTVLEAEGLVVGAADLPRGERRPDPAGRKPREVYASDLVVYLPVKRGEGLVRLSLRHQGCRGGLCFAPKTQEWLVLVGAPSQSSR